MVNKGKQFENQFKKSVPDYCYNQRLPDPPQSFIQSKDTRFSNKNPYDFIMFDNKNRLLYCLELKSTKSTSISFEDISLAKQPTKMIKKHQIEGLVKASAYNYVKAGFIVNFRDEIRNMERTYFIDIKNFMKFYNETTKHSINELDLIYYGAIKVNGERKRVHYIWNIDELLSKISDKI